MDLMNRDVAGIRGRAAPLSGDCPSSSLRRWSRLRWSWAWGSCGSWGPTASRTPHDPRHPLHPGTGVPTP